LESEHLKVLASSQQLLHWLKKLAQRWRGFLVVLANVAHSKLVPLPHSFQEVAQLQIQLLV
jgi:hypothetical protein